MPLRICRLFTLGGRPPDLAGGINGSRIAHSWSERSLAYGFIELIASSLSTSFSLNYFYYILFPRFGFCLFSPLSSPFRTSSSSYCPEEIRRYAVRNKSRGRSEEAGSSH